MSLLDKVLIDLLAEGPLTLSEIVGQVGHLVPAVAALRSGKREAIWYAKKRGWQLNQETDALQQRGRQLLLRSRLHLLSKKCLISHPARNLYGPKAKE